MMHTTKIVRYAAYLEEKAAVFRECQFDFVRRTNSQAGRLVADRDVDAVLRDIACMTRLIDTNIKAKVRALLDQSDLICAVSI